LSKELSQAQLERIEAETDKIGLSSIIIELRGIGATYPTLTNDQLKLIDTIKIVIGDLLHEYLALKPLGCACRIDSLGIKRNPDAVNMHDVLIHIISEEIASEVHERYYRDKEEIRTEDGSQEFDFDAEMKETRKRVEQYLAEGRIEVAERYMEERRKEFVAQGYNIRKLNQAYLAFHSILGQVSEPGSPIYADLKQFRSKSSSLKYFLEKVANMRSCAELTEALRNCQSPETDQAEHMKL